MSRHCQAAVSTFRLTGTAFLVAAAAIWLWPGSASRDQALKNTAPPPVKAGPPDLMSSDAAGPYDALWRLAESNPRALADGLPKRLAALLEAGANEDAAGLAMVAQLAKPWDTPTVANCQEAIARAALAGRRPAAAVSEAAAFFAVARMSDSDLAGALLAEAQGRAVAASDQPPAGPDLARRYEPALRKTQYGSGFGNAHSRGNLQLLSGQSEAASKTFIQAVGLADAGKPWEAAQALEGVARSMRVGYGTAVARAWVEHLCQRDAVALTEAGLAAMPSDAALADLEDRTRPVAAGTRSTLPAPGAEPPLPALSPIALPTDFTLPANEPILLARLAPQADRPLRDWLGRWLTDPATAAESDLTAALARSPLPPNVLLSMGRQYLALSKDARTASQWLCAVDYGNRGVNAWLERWAHHPTPRSAPSLIEQAELTRALESSSLDGIALGEAYAFVGELNADQSKRAAFAGMGVRRGHRALTTITHFDSAAARLLTAMKRCEPVLWDQVNGNNGQNLLAIQWLNQDIERLVPRGDAGLGWARPWARICLSQCTDLLGDPETALRMLEPLAGERFEGDLNVGLAWAKALPLHRLGRNRESVEPLRIVAAQPGEAQHIASRLLVRTLIGLHRHAEAQAALNSFAEQRLFTPQERAALLSQIADASSPVPAAPF